MHRSCPTVRSGGSHRNKVWWIQPYIQTTFIAVEIENLGKLTWIIYLKRQNVTSCLPLSVFWFRLKEEKDDSTFHLLTDFASAGISLPFRKFGTYRTYLSIINVYSPYTKASDNKAKSLHIPISFRSALGRAPGAKKSPAFATNPWQGSVCVCVCVLMLQIPQLCQKGQT